MTRIRLEPLFLPGRSCSLALVRRRAGCGVLLRAKATWGARDIRHAA